MSVNIYRIGGYWSPQSPKFPLTASHWPIFFFFFSLCLLYHALVIITLHLQCVFNALRAPLQELRTKLMKEHTHTHTDICWMCWALESAREKEDRKSSSTLSSYNRGKQALISVKRSSLWDQLEVIYSIHIKTQSHFPAPHSSYSGESFQKETEADRERDGMKRGARGKDVKGYEGSKGAGKEEMRREG